MLENIKIILNISDSSKDNLLNLLINKSITYIYNYLNDPCIEKEFISENYQDAIIELVCDSYSRKYKNQSYIGLKSVTQGSRSKTFADDFNETFVITDSIKMLLPSPKRRLR